VHARGHTHVWIRTPGHDARIHTCSYALGCAFWVHVRTNVHMLQIGGGRGVRAVECEQSSLTARPGRATALFMPLSSMYLPLALPNALMIYACATSRISLCEPCWERQRAVAERDPLLTVQTRLAPEPPPSSARTLSHMHVCTHAHPHAPAHAQAAVTHKRTAMCVCVCVCVCVYVCVYYTRQQTARAGPPAQVAANLCCPLTLSPVCFFVFTRPYMCRVCIA